MTTQIGGFRPKTEPETLVTPSGKLITDTSDYYIALGRRLRREAMRDMVLRLKDALFSKPRRDADQPTPADRFVDEALSPRRDHAPKGA